MRFLTLMTALFVALNAQAIDNPRVGLETTDDFTLHKSNNKNVATITEKNSALDGVVDPFKICIDKGLIYLGAGAANTDADNCYDITDTTNPAMHFRQVVAGVASIGAVNGARNGRFAVDEACDSAHSNSRALTHKDLVHVFPLLNKAKYTGPYAKIWVFDAYSREAAFEENLSCNGWASSNSGYKGEILQVNSGAYKITSQSCNNIAYVMCIYN